MLTYVSFLSYVLAEKGGEEFLNPAYDYISEEPIESIEQAEPEEIEEVIMII
jgi:hypothetical protein